MMIGVSGRAYRWICRVAVWSRYAKLAVLPRYNPGAGISAPLKGYMTEVPTPIASWSLDHQYPHGSVDDRHYQSHHLLAQAVVTTLHPKSWCDLGSGVGSLIEEVARLGIGEVLAIEGSDIALRSGRVRLPPENYIVADLTVPLAIRRIDGSPAKFEVLTALELLEHLPDEKLRTFFSNVRKLDPVWVIVSVGLQPNPPWHVNIKSMREWIETIERSLGGWNYDSALATLIFRKTGRHPRFVNIWPTNHLPECRNLLAFSRVRTG